MDVYVDHYAVLGLASEEEWAKLSEKEITKAFKLKALELHPDKRPDDPNAHENFLKLSASYDVLKDEQKRKLFDVKKRKRMEEEESFNDSKRQKRKSDLDERERYAAAAREFQKYKDERSAKEKAQKFKRDERERYAAAAREFQEYEDERSASEEAKKFNRDEDERSAWKYTEGVDAMRARFGYDYTMKTVIRPSYLRGDYTDEQRKVLKVSWQSVGRGYNAQTLRIYLGSFGVVQKVIVPDKNKNFAYVVMDSRDAAVAVSQTMWLGGRSNPLSAEPLCPVGTKIKR